MVYSSATQPPALQVPQLFQAMLDGAAAGPGPTGATAMTGWVLAAGILLAARLGRGASEASRFDMASLQVTCPVIASPIPCSTNTLHCNTRHEVEPASHVWYWMAFPFERAMTEGPSAAVH